jgi:hypothetical protein
MMGIWRSVWLLHIPTPLDDAPALTNASRSAVGRACGDEGCCYWAAQNEQ